MSLAVGTRLGAYEIVSPLASGGMGDVYRARDPELDRDVAVKVLPAFLAADPISRARFEREAKAVAALSHPNIFAIHAFGTQDGIAYTVSELLEGETLRERLSNGPLPPRKAIDYAVQIAHGLSAAHEKDIVHRDLKPENLFITADGRVKILDFGIARAADAAADPSDAGATMLQTNPGIVMGTASYMSPEQVRGQAVDSRSDLFAFGAVLYEMLAGRRAFQRDTTAETMTAILKDDPPELGQTLADLPPALDPIVRRCLEKNPGERFQSARDLAFALETIAGATPSKGGQARGDGVARRRARRWAVPAIVASLAGGSAIGWWARSRQTPTSAAAPTTFAQITDFPGVERSPSLSPDGKTVVYVGESSGNSDIYSLRVGGRNAVNLTADSPASDTAPVFSPDGQQIAFRSERAEGGIFVMGATGESIRRVTDFGFDPAWSPDGRALVVCSQAVASPFERSGTGELFIVTAATGDRRQLKMARDAMQPSWSPHGGRIAFWSVERATGQRDIWTVAADGTGAASAATSDKAVDWNPVWSADGRDLYFVSDRGGVINLWRMPIDEASGRPLGPPAPLNLPTSFLNGFSLAGDGRLIFAAVDRRSALQRLDFDPMREVVTGAPSVLVQSPRTIRWPDWSPDGETLAFSSFGEGDNLYLIRADGTGYRQITDDTFHNRGPHWYPDGSHILFYSNRGGSYQAWRIRADGGGLQQLTDTPRGVVLPILDPTGHRIAFQPSLSNRWTIADLSTPGAERLEEAPPIEDSQSMGPGSWSPDGSRIAGFRLAAIDRRIFLYDVTTRKYTELGAKGTDPRWLPDGQRLLFTGATGVTLMDTTTGRIREVFKLPSNAGTPNFGFALSANGRRIARVLVEEQSDLWMLSTR